MAGEWRHMRLGDFLTLQRGFDLPQGDRVDGPYPVIASTGPVGNHRNAMVKGPGVVIGRSGSLGGGQYIREDFWPLNTTLWVKDFKGNEPRFCYYFLRSMELGRYNAGSGVPTLNRNHIHPLPVRVPPLKDQRAIASILGALDDKIELNRRMNKTLEAMARAIFRSWFVDFDPVRAKAAVRRDHPKWTNEQVARAACPHLRPDLAVLFPDAFEDSELGEIPRGWGVRTVGELAEIVGGGTPNTKEPSYWEGGTHRWVTPKDLSALTVPVLLTTERRITDAGLECVSSGLLPPGTVLLSSRAPIGYLAITQVPVAINQGFIAMKTRSGVSPHYLLRWTESSHDTIVSRANGSTFLEISKSNFRPIKILVPSTAIHLAFDLLASAFFQRVVKNETESFTLAALRNTLLPKLISGELRVPDAERIIQRKDAKPPRRNEERI